VHPAIEKGTRPHLALATFRKLKQEREASPGFRAVAADGACEQEARGKVVRQLLLVRLLGFEGIARILEAGSRIASFHKFAYMLASTDTALQEHTELRDVELLGYFVDARRCG